MFSQKVKRVISIVLIISKTFCCNGFSVLAGSVEGVVEENQITSSDTIIRITLIIKIKSCEISN